MHLVLTDVLTCPACGPSAGLIVLAERMEGRRVMAGYLGCPVCKTRYPVVEGRADLRCGAGVETAPAPVGDPFRLLALTGLTEARGFVLVAGAAVSLAPDIAAQIPQLQTVTVGGGVSAEGVSPLLVDEGTLPLQSSSMRAVIVTGTVDESSLREYARVVAGGARVVIESADVTREQVEACGLKVAASEGNTIVAVRLT